MTTPETLGPAEKIIQSILSYTDHMYHGRPGVVTKDRSAVGVCWEPVTTKVEDGQTSVYKLNKVGKQTVKTKLGVLVEALTVDGMRKMVRPHVNAPNTVGEFRDPGLFPEVARWMYQQVADVWTLDNEFAARWASHAYAEKHSDLKVVLAAFHLVQSRKGDPVRDAGKIAFHDEDYRDVGEAMMLQRRKDGEDMNAKLFLRVRSVLRLPAVSEINRKLGFGGSARKPFFGRWNTVVTKWLAHHDANPKLLASAVKAGFRTQIMALAQHVGYKPTSAKFYETLRWKQSQADDGRRTIAIGADVAAAESWEGLDEEKVCKRILKSKYDWKRITSLLPKNVGITRATMAAAIQAGALSNRDLVIYTPTLEDLGLLTVPDVRAKWEAATKAAVDMRAVNIARNVRSTEVKEKLQEAADAALKTAVEEVTKGLRLYFLIDVSGSMEHGIQAAKTHLTKMLPGFAPEKIHIATFNQVGQVRELKHASAAGVNQTFRGVSANGGTSHAAGVRALAPYKPTDDEDSLFIFVGDEGEHGTFAAEVRASGLRPMAFGFIRVAGDRGNIIGNTARELGIPLFHIDEKTFDDPYAIPRTLRALVSATPVSTAQFAKAAPARKTLIDTILKTDLLTKPAWA